MYRPTLFTPAADDPRLITLVEMIRITRDTIDALEWEGANTDKLRLTLDHLRRLQAAGHHHLAQF